MPNPLCLVLKEELDFIASDYLLWPTNYTVLSMVGSHFYGSVAVSRFGLKMTIWGGTDEEWPNRHKINDIGKK